MFVGLLGYVPVSLPSASRTNEQQILDALPEVENYYYALNGQRLTALQRSRLFNTALAYQIKYSLTIVGAYIVALLKKGII